VDNRKPMVCCSRLIRTPIIRLTTLSKKRQCRAAESGNNAESDSAAVAVVVVDSMECSNINDFVIISPTATCALLRAVLVVLRIVDRSGEDLARQLTNNYGGGVEVACLSDLPAGSGMGGSSILAACVLQSLSTLLNLASSPDILVHQVRFVAAYNCAGLRRLIMRRCLRLSKCSLQVVVGRIK
jgi:galactokinase